MARVRITHDFHLPALQAFISNPSGGIARDMYRRGQNVRSRALRLAGADTGRLRASIHVELTERGGVVGARVGAAVAYAAFHHEGHGPLRPVLAEVIVFHVRGGGSSPSGCDPSRARNTCGAPCPQPGAKRELRTIRRCQDPDCNILWLTHS
jgi:hypothetical protein